MKKIYFKRWMLFSSFAGMICTTGPTRASDLLGTHATPREKVLLIPYFKNEGEEIEVKGTVNDIYGNPVFGVKVKAKSGDQETTTDKKGNFKIKIEKDAILVFSLNGFLTQELPASSSKMEVTLSESKKRESKFTILYGSQKKSTTVQSISSVYTDDLIKSPVVQINNALPGRLAGLYTVQGSGRPGADVTSLLLRGISPLVLVNGIPRDYASIDPEQIESVTVLKDGLSTVMLGQRSSQGALLITTRKGEVGKQRISFTAQTGIQTPIKMPKPLDAYNYASLYNEALANDGKSPRYTPTDLTAFQDGSDPIGHPNVDWYKQLLKSNAKFSRYNLNVYGGGNSARYYVGLDYLNQGGLLKTDDINSYNTNTDYSRYNIRSNVDIDITPTTLLNLNLFGRLQNGNEPGGVISSTVGGANSLFATVASTPNNAYPVFNPDGSLGGTTDYQRNLWGLSTRSGYFYNTSRDVSADISLKKTLDNVLKGLWVKGLAAFNNSVSEYILRYKTFAVYQRVVNPGAPDSYLQFGTNGAQTNTASNSLQLRNLYAEFTSGYNRSFGKNHVDVLLNANKQDITLGTDLPLKYTNLAGKVNYNYAEKYLAEAAVSYSGLNRFKDGHTTGFFYGAGLGWNISKEDFLKDSPLFSVLKLRANYARTGNANVGYFVYNQYFYGNGNTYYFGVTPVGTNGYAESTLANPNATWEKADKWNVGLDATILKGKLSLAVDYFNNKYFDLMQQRGRNITLLGNAFPDENIGANRYTGLEFDLNYSDHINSFNYFISANVSSLNTKVLYQDEVSRQYPWMVRTGQRVDQIFGYVADGLFQSQADINNSPKFEGYNAVPGDIKYKDLNNDGVINQLDQKALRPNSPQWYYGVNLGFNYKGFDFSALFQGVQNRTIYVSGSTEWAFQNNGLGQAFEQNLGRWTPATATTATQPRLTVGSNPNNEAVSSYWLHSGNYMRLKNVELGYTLPKRLANRISMASIRVFANAVNAFTVSGYSRVDPEVYGNGYPMLKVFNAGLNIKF